MFSGSLVAIVTPLQNGRVDEKAFAELIEFQIANGTHGIVPCGTTGESATLSTAEHERVVALAVEVVNRRIPVIAGTGSNSTEESVLFTKHAKTVGADGALLITPYYNKPTPRGTVSTLCRGREGRRYPVNSVQHSWKNLRQYGSGNGLPPF